jgi:hypothetical protein
MVRQEAVSLFAAAEEAHQWPELPAGTHPWPNSPMAELDLPRLAILPLR